MKKKLLFIFLAAIIAISLIPMIVLFSSADDIKYYDISSYDDLVANKSHYGDANAVFRLTQDITLTGTAMRDDFSATFDGQGHTIYNCTGAFLYLINSATFKNVTFSNKKSSGGSTFTADNSIFGGIGDNDPLGTVTIQDVTVTRNVVENSNDGIGILFNRLRQSSANGTVQFVNCSCTGTATNNGTAGSSNSSGGYVGLANNVKVVFTDCNATVSFGTGSANDGTIDRALVGLGKASNGVTVNVSTQAQLATAAQNANANKDLCKKVQVNLTSDLTLDAWSASDFFGTFDGQDHTIYNCTGGFLWLVNNAAFKNVIISDKTSSGGSAFTATNSVFGGIGDNDPLGTVTVENVTVTRNVTKSANDGLGVFFNSLSQKKVGGTVEIKGCSSTGTVTNNGTAGSSNSSGGFVGTANNVKVVFTDCDANVSFGKGNANDGTIDRALVGLGKASDGVVVNVSTQARLEVAVLHAQDNKDLCKKVEINLKSDLTLSAWSAGDFYGSFDGQGHTIYNLTGGFLWPMYSATFENFTVSNKTAEDGSDMSLTGTISLFGSLSSSDCPAGKTVTIRNVHNERNVTANNALNGGFFRNLAPAGTVVFENCTNSGVQNQGNKTGTVGGLVGTVNGGTIKLVNCVNSGNIIGATAGGLIGNAGSTACTITLIGCGAENCSVGKSVGSGSAAPLIGTCSPGALATYILNAKYCYASNVNVVAATARQFIGVASAEEDTKPTAYVCDIIDVQKNGSNEWGTDANENLIIEGDSADGVLLHTVNFKADGYDPDFASDSNKGADVAISNDGTGVTFTIQNANSQRAMWGDYLVEPLPLNDWMKYTFVFDLTFGNENVAFGLQVDGNNALMVNGAGGVLWYEWNSKEVSASSKDSENWINHTDIPADGKQTFALTLNCDTNTFSLYVKRSNGSFSFVRSVKYDDCIWSDSLIRARFYIRRIDTDLAPDASYTATIENMNIYKGQTYAKRLLLDTVDGAAVRLNTPTGLRFTGRVGKNLLSELKEEYGKENVKIGMLITPTDYLTANSLDFTKEALDGCGALPAGKKYVKIEATTILDDGAVWKFNCVLSNVLEANYDRKFSAITYIEIKDHGDVGYVYSGYLASVNSRSISYVAELALLDLSDTQADEYQYAVDDKYSPYTSAQRETLAGFRTAITVMSYNIEMNDHGDDTRDPSKAVETILEYSADIVGLQEVDDEWNLSALTAAGYAKVDGTHAGTNWENIFYKTAKFNKSGSGSVCFTTLPSSYPGVDAGGADMSGKVNTGFSWALLEDNTTHKTILAISAHLHYRKDKSEDFNSAENLAIRRYEIRLLCAWVADQTFDAVVIMGDMNAHYLSGGGKETINIFKNEGGFAVTRDTAAIKGDTYGTLANSGRTTRPEWIYDYVLTKGNVDTVYYTVVDNKIDKGGTAYPSDHVPVMATLVVY